MRLDGEGLGSDVAHGGLFGSWLGEWLFGLDRPFSRHAAGLDAEGEVFGGVCNLLEMVTQGRHNLLGRLTSDSGLFHEGTESVLGGSEASFKEAEFVGE